MAERHPGASPLLTRYPNFPTQWWGEIRRKPDSWYRSPEGIDTAENILSWQDANGGWPLLNTTRERFDESRAGPWGTRGALVSATVDEIRFLARGFRATEDARYRAALIRGLNFILDAQYPTGGWPKRVPPSEEDYSRYAAFNDDEIPDLMALLKQAARSVDFALLDDADRERAGNAFEKGIEFILKTQISAQGKLTAWAQQYDEVTLEPRAGRAFEPAAISGGESESVLSLLMHIGRPSPEVIRAIEAGVEWYRDVQIDGYEVVSVDGDRLLKATPDAPPLWARFYEIGSNRPIFAGRDGVIRYSMAEIEQERRTGYQWYNKSGTRVFREYEAWRHQRKWDAQPPTMIDEAKVREYTLPDPLLMLAGSRVASVDEWERMRRPEILDLFAQHQHGVTPMQKIATRYEILERDQPGLDGTSRRTQVRIHFPDHPDASYIRVLLNVPADATGPVPTVLYLSFSPAVLMIDEPGLDEGTAWSAALRARVPDREATVLAGIDFKHFMERGYGFATVYYGDIEPDFDHEGKYGVRSMFGADGRKRNGNEWGSIGAWAWGLSRVLDYLLTDPAVDGARVAVSGASRLGKTTLWAAAQDQRFAMAIPLISGEGGGAISRRMFGETVADLTNPRRYHYWFAPDYANYAFAVDDLPVDGHMLISLIAPRPVLNIVGATDHWSDPRGEFAAAVAASPVYDLYGLRGLAGEQFPPLDRPILRDMGFLVHTGGHTVLRLDQKVMTDFMDRHLR